MTVWDRVSWKQLTAISWLFLVLILIFLAFKQSPVFDSNIMTLLPKSEQQPLVQKAVEKMSSRFSKHLVLLVSGVNEGDVRIAIKLLADDLAMTPGVAKVDWHVGNSKFDRTQKELYPYRFAILDAGSRDLLLEGDSEQIKDRALFHLFSPMSVGHSSIIEDPFGLFSELNLHRKNDLNIQVSNSLFKVTGTEEPTYLVRVTLDGEPFSTELQRTVLETIAAHESKLTHASISLSMSGMLLHAAAGADQAKHEITTIGLGSLLGIIITILLIFRQFKPLLLILFAVSIGCLTAAAATILIFERVHLITFAFGAGLVGVSIDYALHFLCERRASPSDQILRKILPGLILGLFSSVMAYAAQALAPFPGLQQMAIFSVVGLSASWLTVVLWFPLLTRGESEQPLSLANKIDWIRKRFPRVEGNTILVIFLLITVFLSMKLLWTSEGLDDVKLLQTSPVKLLEQEKDVQEMLGVSSSSQFLLITADTLEQCLQKEEKVIPILEILKSKGSLSGFQALSLSLPSLSRQVENISLVQHLYQQQLASFYGILKLPDNKLSETQLSLEHASLLRLTSEEWLQLRGSERWKDLIVTNTGTKAATVIRFTGNLNEEAKQSLLALSNEKNGVTYIDQVQNISNLMGQYRTEVIQWIIIAYLCVLLVLLFRYKSQVWRVVLPPLLATIFTLAVMVHLEHGVNLFHLMALILVLGIGIDMGIFLMETSDASHTWLAVSLSAYTSLLAFGLLALSDTPVLHHFGLTVLVGLAFVWLLTPMMRKNNFGDIRS